MMIEQATVIRYQNGIATVQSHAKSGCGGCGSSGSCGTKALSALAGEKTAPRFELAIEQPLNAGDIIEIGLAEKSMLVGIFWLYVVPLCVLLGSALLFSSWIDNELIVALGMFGSTLATFYVIKQTINRRITGEFTPIFLRKL